ncbi:MAG: fructosamine kinase family protein [Sphingomonadaceae bacterium]
MTAFSARVAELTGLAESDLERLAGGDLSEVLLVRRPDGSRLVAKGGPAPDLEAAMLRAIAAAGAPAPAVESEHGDVLLMEYIPNDGVMSEGAWRSLGKAVARLHARREERYGWPNDWSLGTVRLDNRRGEDWIEFWGEQRLRAVAAVLDRPWRERVDKACRSLAGIISRAPPPALLHGDLWTGNVLVNEGELAALIDPACYYGDAEVDIAMLTLFATPPASFWESHGRPAAGWDERQAAYQLFPALVHLRLFGQSYAAMADRLLTRLGA